MTKTLPRARVDRAVSTLPQYMLVIPVLLLLPWFCRYATGTPHRVVFPPYGG